MCIILGDEVRVSSTKIFARQWGPQQVLVYSMDFAAAGDAAMILPVPLLPGAGEAALEFLPLDAYSEFFVDLAGAFTPRVEETLFLAGAEAGETLAVVEVGEFEASFVPQVSDFGRLDPRFRLPAGIWRHLPDYGDWGFAVFQIKPMARLLAEWMPEQPVHPMAFRFLSRDPGSLFFPTVHVHDRQWHEFAEFDHELYFQGEAAGDTGAEQSLGPLGPFMRGAHGGIVAGDQAGFRLDVRGLYRNQDVWIGPSPQLPVAS